VQNLSLEGAIGIDKSVQFRKEQNKFIPHHTFRPSLFRQPSLAEGRLKPSSYRKSTSIGRESSTLLPNFEIVDGTQKEMKNYRSAVNIFSLPKTIVRHSSDSDDSLDEIDFGEKEIGIIKNGNTPHEKGINENTCLMSKVVM
jgi:hypothetical protein